MNDIACRLMETRLCPPAWYCRTLCARFESDDPTPWIEGAKPVTGRNVFENNDSEDHEAAGDGPHVLLPPLDENHHYELTKLPSGRSAVVVEKNVPDNSEFDRAFPGTDQFGRHKL